MSIHELGYEGEVEEHVPVEELHRARCNECGWRGEEHDSLDWKSAEAEAVEHWENECPGNDDEEDDDD